MLRRAAVLGSLFLLLFFFATPASPQENTAKIHGTVYDWFYFEPLNNAIVEINTAPKQTVVADNGEYSFDVPLGDYTISASYYVQNTLISYDEDNLSIVAAGEYQVDLIPLPVIDENDLPENIVPKIDDAVESNLLTGVAVLLVIAAAAISLGYLGTRRRPKAVAEPVVKVVGLPSDLQQIVEILRESGGRMNQVDLRKRIPYSEAKVSLMLSDLEHRGVVRRLKRGRGNIIVLSDLGGVLTEAEDVRLDYSGRRPCGHNGRHLRRKKRNENFGLD